MANFRHRVRQCVRDNLTNAFDDESYRKEILDSLPIDTVGDLFAYCEDLNTLKVDYRNPEHEKLVLVAVTNFINEYKAKEQTCRNIESL